MYLRFPVAGDAHDRSFAWSDARFFKDGALDQIISTLDAIPRTAAKVVQASGKEIVNPDLRDHEIAWVEPDDATTEIYKCMADGIRQLNDQFFRFDLTGFVERFQYTVYDAARGPEGYGWHTDLLGKGRPPRKLSFSLQLSDPATYDGGNLEFQGLFDGPATRERGALIVFPSYTRHRVSPVTRGVRRSLVGWTTGPEIR